MRRYQIGAGGAGEELEIECTFSQNIGMVNDRAMMHAKRAAAVRTNRIYPKNSFLLYYFM